MPNSVHESSDSEASYESQPTSPATHRTLALRDKGKGLDIPGSKRKRADTQSGTGDNYRRRTESATAEAEPDDDDLSTYNPEQPMAERRRIHRGFQDLARNMTENKDEFLKPESTGLHETLRRANQLSKQVKQTTDATIDSRLLADTADLSYRKTLLLTQGNRVGSIDVDEFVSKCVTYMQQGRGIQDDDAPELSSTQRYRRRDDGNEVGDDGDMLNWEHLGRFAALPHIYRPAMPGFLLGPLSTEKKVRMITKRTAPLRLNSLQEVRPEVINNEVLAAKENELTAICAGIFQQLKRAQARVQEEVMEIIERDDLDELEVQKMMHLHGLRSTGGIDLMKFITNPKSFGQSVENMFYVSFLIREGQVGMDFDEHGIPALCESERSPLQIIIGKLG
jgi:non-structural maintenance of chromosomes element 4